MGVLYSLLFLVYACMHIILCEREMRICVRIKFNINNKRRFFILFFLQNRKVSRILLIIFFFIFFTNDLLTTISGFTYIRKAVHTTYCVHLMEIILVSVGS